MSIQKDEVASFDPNAGNRIATAIFYVSYHDDREDPDSRPLSVVEEKCAGVYPQIL